VRQAAQGVVVVPVCGGVVGVVVPLSEGAPGGEVWVVGVVGVVRVVDVVGVDGVVLVGVVEVVVVAVVGVVEVVVGVAGTLGVDRGVVSTARPELPSPPGSVSAGGRTCR
jgi:hypothetical protein